MEFRIEMKISDLILQLHLLQLILVGKCIVVRINFQDFVVVGFVC